MDITVSLYEGKRICLAPIDAEKDAVVESRWTHDAEYLRMLDSEPARPVSVAMLKKRYEAIEKKMDENKTMVYFTIRLKPSEGSAEERLIGFAKLYWIEWTNGNALLSLGIGDRQDRGCGYGTEALHLILRYAFRELNLFRLSATVPSYNEPAIRLLKKNGFVEEVRRRQAVYRDGQRWDLVHFGLLSEEWQRPVDSEQ
ncbi:MAG: N-acetyltransferase [Chloroflexi bacterium]|nr:MAG: N-acetyltransferase [Chloroflexota bacterium]